MSTAPNPIQTFDPDSFMAQRKGDSTDSFDPDEFMAQKTSGSATAPSPKPGFLSTVSKVTLGKVNPVETLKSTYQAYKEHPLDTFVQGAKDLAMVPVNAAYQATHHPVDTAVNLTGGPEFAEGLISKNYPEMAGALVGGAANTYGAARGLQNVRSLSESAASALNDAGIPSGPSDEDIARAMRDPQTGKLKPAVRTGSRVVGAVDGGATGLIGGHEYGPVGGAFLGSRIAPDLLETMTPNLPAEDLFQGRVAQGVQNASVRDAVKSSIAASSIPSDPYGPKTPGVTFAPEPRPAFPGEQEGYMASVPRGRLQRLAAAGKPGAAKQLQQVGKTVLYLPPQGYPGPRSGSPYDPPVTSEEALPSAQLDPATGQLKPIYSGGNNRRGNQSLF